MDAIHADNGQRYEPTESNVRDPKTGGRLRDLLVCLIASSEALDARVWLDGVYTEIDDEQIRGEWMNDRDVYFKVEGRVDKRNSS